MSAPPPCDSYIICTTPRSGSTLLCDLLSGTGVAGTPDSFFMGDPDPDWARDWGLPTGHAQPNTAYAKAVVAAAKRAGSGANGVFGLRLMQRDLTRFTGLLGLAFPDHATPCDRITAAFGRCLFIHLTRENKLAQAVSLVRAEQSGLWHRNPNGSERERLAPPGPETYDPARIGAALDAFERSDTAWRRWFATNGVRPLRVTYETLSEAPQQHVDQICAALGQTVPDGVRALPGVQKLADATSRDWIARFRRDKCRGAP